MVGICSQPIPKEPLLLFQVTKLSKISVDSVSMTVTSQLMLFGETSTVCCENHAEYICTLCVGRMQCFVILMQVVHSTIL